MNHYHIQDIKETQQKNFNTFFRYPMSSQRWKKSDSFAAHFKQHFKDTTSCADLRKYMTFKVVKHLNLIGTMKTFMKPNCNLCMEEHLTIQKKLRDKPVTFMNNKAEIYEACRKKTTYRRFCLSTNDPSFNG